MSTVSPFYISGCTRLVRIEIDYINELRELYIDDCPVLLVDGIQNFSDMVSIENLALKGIAETGAIDLSFAPNLKTLDTTGTPITTITLANTDATVTADSGTNVTIPPLPPTTTDFTEINSSLTSYDFSTLPNLVNINIQGSQFTTLNVSSNNSLVSLNAFGNQVSILTLPASTSLTVLNIGNNQLSGSLILAMYPLTTINCKLNQLTSLTVSTATEVLECSDNPGLTLDLSSLSFLNRLTAYNCAITGLNVLETPLLTYLACTGNNINQVAADAIVAALVYNDQENGTLIIKSQRAPIGNLTITGGAWDILRDTKGWTIL